MRNSPNHTDKDNALVATPGLSTVSVRVTKFEARLLHNYTVLVTRTLGVGSMFTPITGRNYEVTLCSSCNSSDETTALCCTSAHCSGLSPCCAAPVRTAVVCHRVVLHQCALQWSVTVLCCTSAHCSGMSPCCAAPVRTVVVCHRVVLHQCAL